MKNPFNPSFSKVPSIFLNRNSLTSRIVTELENGDSPFQTSLIYDEMSKKEQEFVQAMATIDQPKNQMLLDLF